MRRPTLKLFGRIFQRGETIESRDFAADQNKWAQLIEHRYVDLVDKPGSEPVPVDEMSRDEIAFAIGGVIAPPAPTVLGPDELVVPLEPPDGRRICPDCDFVANTSHGLKIHAGRRHKKE